MNTIQAAVCSKSFSAGAVLAAVSVLASLLVVSLATN
jgi:hypothetical protein